VRGPGFACIRAQQPNADARKPAWREPVAGAVCANGGGRRPVHRRPTTCTVETEPTPIVEMPLLQVSPSAATALEEARAAQEVPDTFGVRVFAQADESGEAALALAFSEEPIEGDQVTEQEGTQIYVAPELAEPLAESVLDVEDTPEGPQLTLVPQADEEQ